MLEKLISKFFVKTSSAKSIKPLTVIREREEFADKRAVKDSALFMRRKTESPVVTKKIIEKRAPRYTSESALIERERAYALIFRACSLR